MDYNLQRPSESFVSFCSESVWSLLNPPSLYLETVPDYPVTTLGLGPFLPEGVQEDPWGRSALRYAAEWHRVYSMDGLNVFW